VGYVISVSYIVRHRLKGLHDNIVSDKNEVGIEMGYMKSHFEISGCVGRRGT
jgi:hypothetical protein